jgi:methylthioribose-1-phosphate isomerase
MPFFPGKSLERFELHVQKVFQVLADARPTAVDPVNACARFWQRWHRHHGHGGDKQELALRVLKFSPMKMWSTAAPSVNGCGAHRDGMTILTHCNAGWLAFVDIGSAPRPSTKRNLKATLSRPLRRNPPVLGSDPDGLGTGAAGIPTILSG